MCHCFRSLEIEQPSSTTQNNFTQTENIFFKKQWKTTFSLSLKTESSISLSNFPLSSASCLCFFCLEQNRWSLKRANKKLKYSLIGNGIWWISLLRKTDYLTIGGAKETRQKREDFGFIIVMLMEEEVMIQKQSRRLLGDGKLSAVIG